MNAIIAISALTFLTISIDGHPAFRKQFDRVVNSNACLKRCMDNVHETDLELNIVKTVDYANYLLNLDTICDIIAKARNCLENCQVNSNPFNLRSMTIMCKPEIRKVTKEYAKCMKEEGKTVQSICENQCGDYKQLNEQIEVATVELNSKKQPDKEKFNEIMLKTNDACGMTKCYARCNRNHFASACHHLGKEDAGEFLYSFIDAVNDAMIQDAEEKQLVEIISKTSPPQCNYLYARGVLFNEKEDILMLKRIMSQQIVNAEQSQQQKKATTAKDELEELQRRILLKELRVLEERERLIAKESYKLDMEIAFASRKGGF